MGRDSSPAAGVHAGIYYRKFGHSRRGILVPNAAWLANDLQGLVEDRTVVFYDPRGRGNSVPLPDNTPATLEGELEDLDLVRRHCGLDQVTLFGWSYHGGVAAHYAGRHPEVVPRLVLSGPIAPRRVPYSDQAAAALQSRLDMAAVAEFMKSPPADPAEATKVWNAIALRGYFAAGGAFARSAPKTLSLRE